MGRPSFKIDPQILRELREEKGKTQEAIANPCLTLTYHIF